MSYTEGLDKAKTEELYANMLASCARFDKLDVELREKKTSDLESFRLVNAEDSEHEDRIANMVFKSIMDQWINKKWLKFDTIDQHINALLTVSISMSLLWLRSTCATCTPKRNTRRQNRPLIVPSRSSVSFDSTWVDPPPIPTRKIPLVEALELSQAVFFIYNKHSVR